MKITLLSDDKENKNFKCEHGLSLLIYENEKTFLFDFGETNAYLENAKNLGIDLKKIDFLVLSHGDYDHANGLKFFPFSLPLYAHPDIFKKRISKRTGLHGGFNLRREEVEKRFSLFLKKSAYSITDGVIFSGEIERKEEVPSSLLPMLDESKKEYKHFDDSALFVKTESGLVVITGCSHSGLINILEYAKKVTNQNKIYAVIGGFHLKNIDENTKKIEEYLKKENVEKIIPLHCTDESVINDFTKIFKDKVINLKVGESVLI